MVGKTALADVTVAVGKIDPRKNPTTAVTYIDIGAIDQECKVVEGPTSILGADAPSRARQALAPRDVLVSTVRPNLNAVAMVGERHNGAVGSTGFCVLRSDLDRLDPNYLFHWVRTPMFVDEMVRQASGASYPAVSDRIVKGSFVPLPPIEEQRRIAAILDAADALRAKRRQVLAKLDTLTQAIFIDMFGDPGSNPKGLPIAAMISLVDPRRPITYGILKPGEDLQGGVPYLRVVDMADRTIRADGMRKTSEEISKRYKRSILADGDIVMSIRGHVGRLAMVTPEVAGANITQDTARLAIEGAEPWYVLECLRAESTQRWMRTFTKGAAVRGINLGDVKKIPIPVPPLPEQRRFTSLAATVSEDRKQHKRQIEHLDTLFATLQQRAFRGEL